LNQQFLKSWYGSRDQPETLLAKWKQKTMPKQQPDLPDLSDQQVTTLAVYPSRASRNFQQQRSRVRLFWD